MAKNPSVEISKVASGAGKFIQPFDATDFIEKAVEYFETREQEQTERERIRADRDSFVEATQAKKNIILEVTGRRFDEREEILSEMSAAMHRAQANGDHEMMQAILQAMKEVTKENPLDGLSELAGEAEGIDS